MASKILITGANGFIGSHTTLFMESLGHMLVPVDVLPRSSELSLLPIGTASHIMDVTDARAFRDLCDKERPTHIFHAAHPPRDETPAVLNYCYDAMTNILEAAKEFKLQRVVYSSSASIYGQLRKKDGTAVREDDAVTIYPTYFYRSAKMVSEWMGDFYKERERVSFTALRYSSVYGPGLARSIPLELKKGFSDSRVGLFSLVSQTIRFMSMMLRMPSAACFFQKSRLAAPTISAWAKRMIARACGKRLKERCLICPLK